MQTAMKPKAINGIDTEYLRAAIEKVAMNPAMGMTKWNVSTEWTGGTRSDTRVTNYMIAGNTIEKDFTISIDEPRELGGTNRFANPQEYLMAAMNSCMLVGYATVCSLEGIQLEELRIESEGEIDLRGLFGLDPTVKPGYDRLHYRVFIKGDGTPEQFQRVHETVAATSPNRFNMAKPITLTSELVVE